MEIITTHLKVFTFEELSESAKQKALDDWCVSGIDYEWWDFVYEDANEIGRILGIEIDKIFFSGFSSQGDGACFNGSYDTKKVVKKLFVILLLPMKNYIGLLMH